MCRLIDVLEPTICLVTGYVRRQFGIQSTMFAAQSDWTQEILPSVQEQAACVF